MYEWYFGTDRQPEDKRNAIADMVMGIAGCAGMFLAGAVAVVMWVEGCI